MQRGKIVIASAVALAGTMPARAECQLGKIATLPITLRGARPETTAKINGRETHFLVDSGAFYSMISPGSAAENNLKLQSTPFGFQIQGVGGSAQASITTVKALTLAGVDLSNIQFIVAGSETGGAGLIGQNVLHLGDAEYDLPHGAINLFRPKGCGSKVLAYWLSEGQSYSELALENTGNRLGHIYAVVRINGQPVKAMFDTGASSTVISVATARRLGIKTDGPGVVAAGLSRGVGSRMVRSWIAPIDLIQVGGETLRNTHLAVSDLGEDTEMLVGADFFLAHRVYVANSQSKMWFSYSGGGFFDALHHHDNAVDASGKAINLTDKTGDPTDAEGYSRRGMAELAKGDREAAIADLNRAVELAPDVATYLIERAGLQRRAGHRDLAEKDLDKALSLKPNDPQVLIERARMRLADHDLQGAISDMDVASASLEKASDERFELAEVYTSVELPGKGLSEFDQWIAAHPDDNRRPIALNGRCWARALLGQDLPKALNDCNAAIKAMPRKENGLDSRGLVHLRMGDAGEAVKDYDAALTIDPKMAWALYGRGLAKLRLGQKAEGEKDIAAAKTIAPHIADRAKRWGVTS